VRCRIKDPLGTGENVIDQFYLAKTLYVFVFQKSTKPFAICLQPTLGRLIQSRITFEVIVGSRNYQGSMRTWCIAKDLLIELHR